MGFVRIRFLLEGEGWDGDVNTYQHAEKRNDCLLR